MELLVEAPSVRCFAADGHATIGSDRKDEIRPLHVLPRRNLRQQGANDLSLIMGYFASYGEN